MVEKSVQSDKNHIVAIAWEMFWEKGYDNVELNEIMEQSGLIKEEFEKYFTNKEDILYSLSNLFDERYAELMVEMNPKLSSYEKLVLLNKELFDMIENKIPMKLLGNLYSSQMIDNGDKHLLDKERLYYKLVNQIMEEGKLSGEFKTNSSTDELVEAYAMLERGLLCDWCIGQNQKNLTKNSNKLMPNFLAGLLYIQK
ncbi:MAG: TetR/AcrR family transcriptional regulator [Herbinix sp.]|nr:TetR/AcrR family transcriptional regulator [Herbinix sp.]